jgi:ABC-2 type transport system ATP-binding protein
MGEQSVPPVVVEARNLGRRYAKRQVLSGIDLQIREGEIFGILGPDGAGKTTLLQLFAAILDPTEGQCRSLGFDTVRHASDVVGRIGYMSQGFTLYDRLSVDENLRFAAQIRGVTGATWEARRTRLLQMAGLTPFGNRRAGHLSGGMRKKLALCANLIHEPPLLLLDEPSLGVDPLSRRELWDMLRDFRRKRATIVVATSYMDEAMFCDRLAFLNSGRLLAQGTPAELQARSGTAVYEIVTASMEATEESLATRRDVVAVQRLPDRLRVQVDRAATTDENRVASLAGLGEANPVTPSLEDAFVALSRGEERAPPSRAPRVEVKVDYHGHAIDANGITCRFGSFIALDRVSLTVNRGEVFGFLGPNGAGKTTFIRALCGLTTPQAGSISVAGIDVLRHRRRLRQRIGYMSQRFSLYPDLTIRENLQFSAGAYGLASSEKRRETAWASDMVGLTDLHDRPVMEVSGAVRQRLALACSIMHRPAVLFLDEPTSGVDPSSRYRFWRLIHTLARSGMTVFVTTHDLDEAAYCHRLGLMFEGRLIAAGTLEGLRAAFADKPPRTVKDVFMAYMARQASERQRRGGSNSMATP